MNEEQFERFMGLMGAIQSDMNRIANQLEEWDNHDGTSSIVQSTHRTHSNNNW